MDVYEDEPVIGADHPLLKMDQALCTPHLGYVVNDSFDGMYNEMIDNSLAWVQGRPANVLNPEALAK